MPSHATRNHAISHSALHSLTAGAAAIGGKSLAMLCIAVLVSIPLTFSAAQERETLAILPVFHDRLNTSGREGPLQLREQRFAVFVYRNAVAVFSAARFVNVGMTPVIQEFALPSTGHESGEVKGGGKVSNGILSVHLHVEDERVIPDIADDGDGEWFTIRAEFAPAQERRITAMFWAQTSLTDVDSMPGLDTSVIAAGKRGFMIDLCHSSIWNGVVGSVEVHVVIKAEMSFDGDAFAAQPETYELRDSTLTWSFRNLEASSADDIAVSYDPSGPWGTTPNTMAKLAHYIVGSVYDDLLQYDKWMEEDR